MNINDSDCDIVNTKLYFPPNTVTKILWEPSVKLNASDKHLLSAIRQRDRFFTCITLSL